VYVKTSALYMLSGLDYLASSQNLLTTPHSTMPGYLLLALGESTLLLALGEALTGVCFLGKTREFYLPSTNLAA
jgi:hypothetical protein